MQIWCGLGYHDYMDVGLLAAFILILELLWLLYGGISAPLYYFRLCLCKRDIFLSNKRRMPCRYTQTPC
jgi:hypothetical protein